MLQQTTVVTVIPYYNRFLTLWPNVHALAGADDADVMREWAGLGYYARARNLLKAARAVVADHGGRFPSDEAGLRTLPGIGPYTAAAIAAIAFDQPANVVDGNVERVMARLFAIETPLPAAKPHLSAHAAELVPHGRPGDHAQALMDLGATICTPKSPSCSRCPLIDGCAGQAQGIAALLPRQSPKPIKPVRHGAVWLGWRADGALLVERRAPKGLLGGMLGLPVSDLRAPSPDDPAPIHADWAALHTEARHSFTHFHLRLTAHHARLPDMTPPAPFFFLPADEVTPSSFPTLFRKVLALVSGLEENTKHDYVDTAKDN